MSRPNLAQMRAKHALEKIKAYKTANAPDAQKRFNAYVSSLGPMILMNGLGQACAFYLANKKTEHRDVLKILDDWLKTEGRPLHAMSTKGHIVERIVNVDADVYRLARVEALAYLDWLKKFAKAFLASEADQNENNGEV